MLEIILAVLVGLLSVALVFEIILVRRAARSTETLVEAGEAYAQSFQQIVVSMAAIHSQISEITDDVRDIGDDTILMKGILEVHNKALDLKTLVTLLDKLNKTKE